MQIYVQFASGSIICSYFMFCTRFSTAVRIKVLDISEKAVTCGSVFYLDEDDKIFCRWSCFDCRWCDKIWE